MNDKDIYDWGREIGEGINKFVNSGEIKELQENIQATVENAMEEVRRSVQDAADYVGKAGQKAVNKMDSAWNTGTKDRAAGVQTYPQKEKRHLPVVKRPEGRVSGILMEVFLWRGDRVDGIRHGYPVGMAQRKSGGHGNRDMDVRRICRLCGNLYGGCPGGRHVEAACRAVPEICKDHGRAGFLPIGRAGAGCQEKRSVCPEGFKGDDRQGMVSGRTFGRAGNLFYADGRSLPDVYGCTGAVKAAQGGGRTAGSAA